MRRVLPVLLIALLLSGACTSAPRWQTTRRPDARDAAAMLATDTLGLRRDDRPEEVPIVPMRRRLRPCCAFGSKLRVRIGAVKIPGFQIENIHGPDEIGYHNYDAGRRGDDVSEGNENNGLVYTCRGGFIDTAHVRDYADWALYLATEIGRNLEKGTVIRLPDDEGGARRFVLEPVDPKVIQIVGRRGLAAPLGVWAAFQLSLWHEIATWYGWSAFDAFSERASAFSPEDLYSNLLGAKLAEPIITGGDSSSEDLFDRAVDAWLAESLRFLGAVDARFGEQVIGSVDGSWWNSRARIPDADLVLRRNVQSGNRIEPWQVPTSQMGNDLAGRLGEQCSANLEPHVLGNPSRIPGLAFRDVLKFEVDVDSGLQSKPAFRELGASVTQQDFPRILEIIREEIRQEFGPLGDSKDSGPAS